MLLGAEVLKVPHLESMRHTRVTLDARHGACNFLLADNVNPAHDKEAYIHSSWTYSNAVSTRRISTWRATRTLLPL